MVGLAELAAGQHQEGIGKALLVLEAVGLQGVVAVDQGEDGLKIPRLVEVVPVFHQGHAAKAVGAPGYQGRLAHSLQRGGGKAPAGGGGQGLGDHPVGASVRLLPADQLDAEQGLVGHGVVIHHEGLLRGQGGGVGQAVGPGVHPLDPLAADGGVQGQLAVHAVRGA